MSINHRNGLPEGLVSVLQTPFFPDGEIDFGSMERLLEDIIQAGVDGVVAPAVASEVGFLSQSERYALVRKVSAIVGGRIPLIVGASSLSVSECRAYARFAEEIEATGYLVAVPGELYQSSHEIVPFFQSIASASQLPLLIQDLQWNDYGLTLSVIKDLWISIPTLAGFKVETVPAGPKYTQIRNELGNEVYLCGGWAIPQLIESLDRGVNAMIPESSMIRVYKAILKLYQKGQRDDAVELFHRLLPVLSFTNQEITISIAFFKRLLVRRGIFRSDRLRCSGFIWDPYNQKIADELIDHYLKIENSIRSME